MADYFERQEARAVLEVEAAKVAPCDGTDPQLVKQHLRELELVALAHRLQVFHRVARGSLLRVGSRWLQEHPDNPDWLLFKTHVLEAFVSCDVQNNQEKALRDTTRQPGEALLSYNRRYEEAAEDAFPGQRNQEQHSTLVRLYATGLKDRALVRKVMTPDRPATLDVAMTRATASERREENLAWCGYEPMEVDAFHTKPRPPPKSDSTVERDIHLLRTQYGKLEAMLDRVLEASLRPPADAPSRDARTVQCFYCTRKGHTMRECRTKQRAEAMSKGSPPCQGAAETASHHDA